MKLYENQEVVNQLKRILKEDYPYLEYSEQMSKKLSEGLGQVRTDRLYVSVRPGMTHTARDRNVIVDICEELYQATKIPFHFFNVQSAGHFYAGADQSVSPQILETRWTSFCLMVGDL